MSMPPFCIFHLLCMHVLTCSATDVTEAMRTELLEDIKDRFKPTDYSLMTHNCEHGACACVVE